MGQRRLKEVKGDNLAKRPGVKKTGNTILDKTQTRKGEVMFAQRRKSADVNVRASQHIIDVPVNKSIYNGYDGEQWTPNMDKNRKPNKQPRLRIIPIGGLGEMGIGKNMTAFEYDNEIIVVDMGFIFPGDGYPGVNYIVPDITYLEERKHMIKGIFFTHAHLDHIGAFRHLIPKIPAKVYATKFTIGMLKKNKEESPDDTEIEYIEMNPENHDTVQVGDNFSVEFVRVNHSIPDCAALIIRTPVGNVFHSGDWRFESDPVDGLQFDMPRITEVASKEGFTLMLNESTNIDSQGTHTHSEYDIKESFGEIMDQFPNSRIIVSSFSSQIYRIQTLIDQAAAHGRKVAFAGFSMLQNVEVALKSGIINIPKNTVMKMEDIIKQPDGKIVVVCTGSQGEYNAVLNRIVVGEHKYIKTKRSDIIVFSSNPVPGNEVSVARTVSNLMREGSDVLQNNKTAQYNIGPLHLSGHAYFDDHVKLIDAVHPKYYMPIHGEFSMLHNNAEMAEKNGGMSRDHIFVCDSGDVLELYHDGTAKKNGRIHVGGIMYDDTGNIVNEVVLKDRIHMSTEGFFIVTLTVQRGSGKLLSSPDIVSRGFIYLRDSEDLINEVRQYLKQKVAASFNGDHDINELKNEIKNEITQILYDRTHHTPIVIPIVNEVGAAYSKAKTTKAPVNTVKTPVNTLRRPSATSRVKKSVRPSIKNPNEISFKKKPTGPKAGGLWR